MQCIPTRRNELTRQAARLFAQKGYHGTSMGDLAQAMGVQKGSLYSLTESKQELLYETMREGAAAFHAGLDAIPEDAGASERIRLALRAHLRVVAEQLDLATVFIREWRYLEGERREQIVAERRRYEERLRGLFRDGREHGELSHRPRRERRGAARPLRRKLGVHVADARARHGCGGRLVRRDPRRRHPRLRHCRKRLTCRRRQTSERIRSRACTAS